ncbi:hypothetical protein JCGZ_09569 [Jatropha curcas]|uniref:Uncharacterized protein n=1 Tax=Jatropha curcas TaxID=180498 RepID=A0A067LKU0_JATCU|nr:uncharacterized protein LOC105641318 isoform X2 [Jatropha curcas]KDP45320.1 hypothetical protein JCGZ_09569 [Jatropha curcas]
MAYTGKFLNPIRQSFSSISYFYSSSSISRTKTFNSKFELVRAWMKQLEPSIQCRCSNFQCKLNLHAQFIRNLYLSGSMIGVPFVIGSIGFSTQVAYAMDGQEILVDDRDFLDSSDRERDSPVAWMFLKKFWLPAFCFLTVLVNWDHPIILITKVALFLLSTKPSPLSVYVFVEQLCDRSMRQQPYMYFLKSLYANKVEVQDYKFFCLATVEVKGQTLTLLGVLGGWWALPLSQTAFSVFLDSVLY